MAMPHEESGELADLGIENWIKAGREESDLLDSEGGQEVRWTPELGWQAIE